jgi:NADH-quinone oxidoreductase subunit A
MAQYLPVLALLVLAALFAAVSFVVSKLLAPRNPTVEKFAPYECGIIPGREPPERFPVRFYLVAMLFVIFDIEIVFLYPWAIANNQLGLYGLIAILIFTALVFESFVYLISKGALDWGPLQINRRQDLALPSMGEMRSADRTVATTVRRVGLEGRYEDALDAVERHVVNPVTEPGPEPDPDDSPDPEPERQEVAA